MLSRLVIAFLPKSKHLLISWLQSPSAVILEPKKIKSVTVYIVFPSICHEVMEPDAMIIVFFNVEFQANFFTLLFHFHQGGSAIQVGIIYISEVTDIFPGNLDSSLCLAFHMM